MVATLSLEIALYSTVLTFSLVYGTLMLSRQGENNGQTIGKNAMGIRVVRPDGAPITINLATKREVFGKGILGLIPFYGIVDVLWPLGDAENQALHDEVANTYVVPVAAQTAASDAALSTSREVFAPPTAALDLPPVDRAPPPVAPLPAPDLGGFAPRWTNRHLCPTRRLRNRTTTNRPSRRARTSPAPSGRPTTNPADSAPMPSDEPTLLWTPSPERAEATTLARYTRWLQETRGLNFADYEALWRWSVDELDAFWASIWEFSDVQADGYDGQVLGSQAIPGAEWFPGTRLSYAEHIFRGKSDDDVAIRHASELRELGEWTWGQLSLETALYRFRAAQARRRAGRPRRRLHPEHPGGDRGVPGVRVDRRRVVVVLTRLRRAQRRRPLRADRAEGAAGSRRVPLRRQGLRPP